MATGLEASTGGLPMPSRVFELDCVSRLEQNRDISSTELLGENPRGYPGEVAGRERLEVDTALRR